MADILRTIGSDDDEALLISRTRTVVMVSWFFVITGGLGFSVMHGPQKSLLLMNMETPKKVIRSPALAFSVLMGYGKTEQMGTGLHLRQWARCFIIQKGEERMAFISVDVGMIGDGLRLAVIRKLQRRYGPIYNVDNVIISGTHTHSAPGGFLLHLLFDLPSLGFSAQTFGALASGIVKSVIRAHERLQRGRIFISKGHVEGANINRSPTAYVQNPAEERAKYPHETDTEMVQMKFVTADMKPLGVINWFAVHPTSMNNTNTLVSSDNMGYASILFEKRMNPGRVPGKGPFVAAMASSNLGDVSPNIMGPRCEKTGRACDLHTSTCPVKWDQCVSPGPGVDMFDSTRIIATRIYRTAWDLFNNDEGIEIKGDLKIVHQYKDMPSAVEEIVREDGSVVTVRGCLPAMGYSFAAGTTDGPGAFQFQQGTVTHNPLWNIIRDFLAKPTLEDEKCHAPKPILLATGHMKAPFEWQPRIVSTQLALIGNVAIAAVPGEFTTMAGRRLRNLLVDELGKGGIANPMPIVAGLCNTYSDYITTYEEYQVQRYEGASTIYGPHTLLIFLNQYRKLANALMKNVNLGRGPEPPELFNDVISFIPPVIYDNKPFNATNYGEPTINPKSVAYPGERVIARFISGNPRNCLKHDETFCTVEREEGQEGSDVWTVVATDADWETKVRWIRKSGILGTSETEVEYTVPDDARPGIYRIRHFGCYKYMWGGAIYPYVGTSLTFKVLSNDRDDIAGAINKREEFLKKIWCSHPYRNLILLRNKIAPTRWEDSDHLQQGISKISKNVINEDMESGLNRAANGVSLPDSDFLNSTDFNQTSYGMVKRDALYIVIPISIIYCLIFITGVVGNVVTCIVIARNKYMHTATNYYLFSLAISDLLLLVSGLPQEIVQMWCRYPYLFGEVFCVLRGLAAETSTNATVLTITAFTVERYVAICHPFLAQTMSKLSRAVKLIVVIWLVALSFAIPQAIQFGVVGEPGATFCTVKQIIIDHSFELSSFLFFVTPMTLITVLYALIGVKLRKSNMIKRDCGSFYKNYENRRNSQSRRHQLPNQSSRRVLKMLVAVVVAFFICWAPFHAQRLVYIYGAGEDNTSKSPIMKHIYEVITYISGILYYVSTTINPILYHIMSLKFREAFKDTIARCCGLPSLKNRRGRRSYSILTRSQQQGAVFGIGPYSHSTDNSNNSVRDDSIPSTCLNSTSEILPSYPLRYKSRRKTISVSEATDDSAKTELTEISQKPCYQSYNVRPKQFTVVLRLNKADAGKKSNGAKIFWRKTKSPDSNLTFWSVFKCIKSDPNADKQKAKPRYYLEPSSPYEMKTEYQRRHSAGLDGPPKISEDFNMDRMRRSFSNHSVGTAFSNNVSNSSLKDYDRVALRDELTLHMTELLKSEGFENEK